MPIFEYRCPSCDAEFECLVRGTDAPACPSCGGTTLERLLTTFAVSSAETSKRVLTSAREAYRRSRDRTDRLRHEAEEVREHVREDYGIDAGAKTKQGA